MEFWTTKDLAEAAQVTAEYIRQEIWSEKIKCQKIGRDWVIPEEEAQRWLSERRAKQDVDTKPET